MNPSRSAGIVATLALAIFPRLRRKKQEQAPPVAAPPAASSTGTSPAARGPPPPKSGISRPKQRRPVYTGNRLSIFLPGRSIYRGPGLAVNAPPSRPMPSAGGAGDPASGLCPSCGARPPPEGGLCDRCTVQARIVETENLLTSLRAKGIDVALAETSVHQARVALALDTFREVEDLCERAAAAAKKSDSDHDRAREMLSECERSIASIIESGNDTSAAQGSLERATGHFNRGQYAAAIGLASEIIEWSRDRPQRPNTRVTQLAEVAPPRKEGESPGIPPPLPETSRPSPYTLYDCPEPSAHPGECAVCGEPLEADWNSCPNCSALIKGGVPARMCPCCGRELLPDWRLCPYCDAELPGVEGAGPSRRRWQRGTAASVAPKLPPEVRERELLEHMERTGKMLENASTRGRDVTKARNLLDLAASFARSRNYDKGERYARKARNVAETVLSS